MRMYARIEKWREHISGGYLKERQADLAVKNRRLRMKNPIWHRVAHGSSVEHCQPGSVEFGRSRH